MDCSLPGSSVHGIFHAIVLEWIVISFSRGSSQPRDRTQVSHIVDRRFTIWATRGSYKIQYHHKKYYWYITLSTFCYTSSLYMYNAYIFFPAPLESKLLRLWPFPLKSAYLQILLHCVHPCVLSGVQLFCDPMDCSLSGSSVHGILQARILEWIAMPSSRGSSQPKDQTQVSWIAGRFFTKKPKGV